MNVNLNNNFILPTFCARNLSFSVQWKRMNGILSFDSLPSIGSVKDDSEVC